MPHLRSASIPPEVDTNVSWTFVGPRQILIADHLSVQNLQLASSLSRVVLAQLYIFFLVFPDLREIEELRKISRLAKVMF
jgi:hypothetical protein